MAFYYGVNSMDSISRGANGKVDSKRFSKGLNKKKGQTDKLHTLHLDGLFSEHLSWIIWFNFSTFNIHINLRWL